MSESYDLERPGRFTVGAIGEPGHRLFYFQGFGTGVEVSVKCEKQQAQALADHLLKLLDDLPGSGDPADAPAAAEALPPSELAWAVGSISIGLDREQGEVVVVLEEFVDPEESDEAPAHLRVRLLPHQVRGLAAQVDALVSSSRPLCRLCERPIDPSGHACPRLN
ncbi:MAG: DUF3090 family protein [Acidimicrobiales bacterium]